MRCGGPLQEAEPQCWNSPKASSNIASPYILNEFDADPADLKAALGEKGEELLGQLAEAFVGEALAKAEAKGLAKGRASTLNRQLEYRFGPLSPVVRERVQCASKHELDEWRDAVLNAPTLEAVIGDTPRH